MKTAPTVQQILDRHHEATNQYRAMYMEAMRCLAAEGARVTLARAHGRTSQRLGAVGGVCIGYGLTVFPASVASALAFLLCGIGLNALPILLPLHDRPTSATSTKRALAESGVEWAPSPNREMY